MNNKMRSIYIAHIIITIIFIIPDHTIIVLLLYSYQTARVIPGPDIGNILAQRITVISHMPSLLTSKVIDNVQINESSTCRQ